MNKYILFIATFLFIDLIVSNASLSDTKKKDILTQMCHISFASQMSQAGQEPPSGMATYTCNCFFEKVSLGNSIKSAQDHCKEKAATKFDL